MMKRLTFTIIALLSLTAHADVLDEASKLVDSQEWQKALDRLGKAVKSTPKLSSNGQYLYLSGVCEFELGNSSNAEKLLASAVEKKFGAAHLYLGRLAFLRYDFDGASENYSLYRSHLEKTKAKENGLLELYESQLSNAESALSRVERIEVLDSVAVPFDGFFENYILPHSGGKINKPETIPFSDKRDAAIMAFSSESGDYMIWGAQDSTGYVNLMESTRLTDGNWQEPIAAPELLRDGGDADFPFMLSDGTTLYYASDGSSSMGGFDIFVVSRDSQTGEYLQPQNIGMPFNSPYDDYLLAIDEENGIGWWATDRNQLGDKLTIYVYKTNDIRKNYDADAEDIVEKARISDYKSTRAPESEKEYRSLITTIIESDKNNNEEEADFILPFDNGKNYTELNQIPRAAQGSVKSYLMAIESLDKEEFRLSELRKRYALKKADNLKMQIIQFEKEIEQKRIEAVRLRSEAYKQIKSAN